MKNKNLYLLPTDKPSRLFYDFDFKKYYLTKTEVLSYNQELFKNHNIYITSDEEIKDGDFIFYLINRIVGKVLELGRATCNGEYIPRLFTQETKSVTRADCQKVILTTDQYLIKDGVQAIDDGFLEWFVKNPSCELVEVRMNQGRYFDYGGNVHITNAYKIIIPKEEPKQRLEKYSERFDNNKSQIGNPETWGRRIKQETLEGYIQSLFINEHEDEDDKILFSSLIRSGAKWQQEQIGKSEFLQKLRATLSDAEARRLIFETFQNK